MPKVAEIIYICAYLVTYRGKIVVKSKVKITLNSKEFFD